MSETQFTANEARQLTQSFQKGIDNTFEAIRAMAKNGHSYATFNLKSVLLPEEQKETLERIGYKVSLTDTHMNITW